jgi:alpha-L-fucosidase
MALYKRAGAKYFVSMGSHHDNFFLWNSKLHRWNAVNMGPHRDVVGEWQRAAKKYGLHFGVSEHLGASFTWFQDSHKSDKTGPFAGVPYDGADPRFEELYHFPAAPGDTAWYSTNPRWQQMWFNEIKELVDLYHPDLLYTDGGVPFGNEVGRSLIAHFYNSDPNRNGASVQVVYTCKQKSEGRWIEDLERGVMARINPDPWQTDTSIGDWFYNKNWKFRPVSWSIHMLVDIVSKNGNLLLNVVQRPDGSLDPEVEQSLEQMADWITIHGEAIFGTRPWLAYGEGPAHARRGGHFQEDFPYTAKDIRFTSKGATLFAVALGWPDDRQLVVKSLAQLPDGNHITDVRLLGHDGAVEWLQSTNGLVVKLPASRISPYTAALRITGMDLKPAPFQTIAPAVQPDPQGNLKLVPDDAEFHGEQIGQEQRGGQPNIAFWDRAGEWVSWKACFATAGAYVVRADCATPNRGSEFVVEVAGQRLTAFRTVELGKVHVSPAGDQLISVRPRDADHWKAINLRSITLIKAE